MTAWRLVLGFLDCFAFFGGGGKSCNPIFTGLGVLSDILNERHKYTRYYSMATIMYKNTNSVLGPFLERPA